LCELVLVTRRFVPIRVHLCMSSTRVLTRFLAKLSLSLFAALSLAHPAAAQQASVAERYLFNAVNAERTQRGLHPVRWDDALYQAASYHASIMAAHNTISHQFSGEPELSTRGARAGAHFSVISENVAMAPDAVQIHDLWMKSPHHRDNILDDTVDHIAIRVVRRNNELFAVEDFEKAVATLSLNEQEERVAILVQSTADVTILPATAESRRTCEMSTGWSGTRKPWFVMRYTAGDLNHLPDTLVSKLNSGKYHSAAVGACTAASQNFSTYNIAVLLYP
jgi:uncharacterized protein YkwD